MLKSKSPSTVNGAAALLGAVLLVAAPAQAGVIVPLNSDHCAGGCGPVGTTFGYVTFTQNGGAVDIYIGNYLFERDGRKMGEVIRAQQTHFFPGYENEQNRTVDLPG